jgi:hypothetical protein
MADNCSRRPTIENLGGSQLSTSRIIHGTYWFYVWDPSVCVCPLFEQIFRDHRTIAGLNEVMPCRDPSSHDAQRYHHHLQAGGISPQPWERTGHEDHEEIPPIYDPYPIFFAFWRTTWRSSGCSGIRSENHFHHWSSLDVLLATSPGVKFKTPWSWGAWRFGRAEPSAPRGWILETVEATANDPTTQQRRAMPRLWPFQRYSGPKSPRDHQIAGVRRSKNDKSRSILDLWRSKVGTLQSLEMPGSGHPSNSLFVQLLHVQRSYSFTLAKGTNRFCLDCHLNTALNAASIG